MFPSSLDKPVAHFMRPTDCLAAEASLDRAATILRGSSVPMVPIYQGSVLMGVVTDRTLADALSNGFGPYDPAERAVEQIYGTVRVFETGAEALRKMSQGNASALLVIDAEGRVAGVLSASDLYPKQPYQPKPPVVGGMATPFGVYLTNGALGAGVPYWALVSTGVLMFVLVAIGGLLKLLLIKWTHSYDFGGGYSEAWELIPIAFLLLGMRMLPLAGIHAAEHKVVHAIERGEPLVPEVVSRMPRVHPRCGTNLFVGASIFGGILSAPFINDQGLRIVAAALATFLLWRPLGSAMQWLVTTRPPSAKHIEMGIHSGKELLEKYRMNRNTAPNPFQRIWNSGMIHVLAGFLACTLVAQCASWIFHVDLPF